MSTCVFTGPTPAAPVRVRLAGCQPRYYRSSKGRQALSADPGRSLVRDHAGVDDETRVVAQELAAVISDEIEAQQGIGRDLGQWPILIADAILDAFEARPRHA